MRRVVIAIPRDPKTRSGEMLLKLSGIRQCARGRSPATLVDRYADEDRNCREEGRASRRDAGATTLALDRDCRRLHGLNHVISKLGGSSLAANIACELVAITIHFFQSIADFQSSFVLAQMPQHQQC